MKNLLRICIVISLVLGSQIFILAGYAAAQTSPAVTTGNATNITYNSATLNGNLTDIGNASSVEVSFEWGRTIPLSSVTAATVMYGNGTFSFNLTGLFSDTIYIFTAKATGGNVTTYGDPLTFTTLPIIPPSVITGEPTNVGTSSVTLHGNLASLGDTTEVRVSFQWGLTTTYGDDGNQTATQIMNNTGKFSDVLSGLSPNTTYYFRAKAVGNGIDYGADVAFTTRSPDTRAQISIAEEPDDDDAATIRTNIDELRNVFTEERVTGANVACYQAWAIYDPTGMEMLSVRGADETFTNPVFNTDRVIGKTYFAEATVWGDEPPVSVAKLVPRLLGSTLKTYDIKVNFDRISRPDGELITPPSPLEPVSMSFLRGDVSGDGRVDIVDAMFGAQYLVGLREYSGIHLLNMASVHHDNGEDRADIVDCMYLAQYVVHARTSTFDLSSVPTPGYGIRQLPTKDTHILAQYPTVNTGNQNLLCLEAYNTANIQRVLMEFDVSSIPNGATITAASLQLYYSGNLASNPAGLSASVYKLTSTNWTETGANWNSYNGSGSWTSTGGDYATISPTRGSATFPASYGWMLWNVREIVQNAVLNVVEKKVELLLRFDNESPAIDYLPTFISRETVGSPLVPKLVVSYTE